MKTFDCATLIISTTTWLAVASFGGAAMSAPVATTTVPWTVKPSVVTLTNMSLSRVSNTTSSGSGSGSTSGSGNGSSMSDEAGMALHMATASPSPSPSPSPVALTTPPPRVTPPPTPAAPRPVAVHIAERYYPFVTKTIVGSKKELSSVISPEDGLAMYRLMMSFQAFEYSAAAAASLNCVVVDQDTGAWTRVTTTTAVASDATAFCVNRTASDDTKSFGVAQFQRRKAFFSDLQPGKLVHAAKQPTFDVLQQAKIRGWTESPLAAFRVPKLTHWQAAPSLTLVVDIASIQVDSPEKAAAYCQPDPQGLVQRRIEGGDYYKGSPREPFLFLCVTSIERALQDIDPMDKVLAEVRLVDRTWWRFNKCPFGMTRVKDLALGGDAIFSPKKGDKQLLCYKQVRLMDDYDGKNLKDTSDLLQKITIDASQENRADRVQITHHAKSKWDFPPLALDEKLVSAL